MLVCGIDCQDAAPMHSVRRPSGYQKSHLIADVIFMHVCVSLMNYDVEPVDKISAAWRRFSPKEWSFI